MHIFDRDLELTETGDHTLGAEVSDGWSHRGNLNGGFLMALAGKAVSRYSEKSESLLITANYLDRCLPGTIHIRIEELPRSKNFDRFEVTLTQHDHEVLRAFCTLSAKGGKTENLSSSDDYAPSAREEDCIEMSRPGITPLYDHVSVRIDPQTAGWMGDELKAPAVERGWIRFKEPRTFDIPAAIMAVDCFPPAIFVTRGESPWVPTLEFAVQVRGKPTSDILRCSFSCSFVTDGILMEDGVITEPDGRIIALSRQTAVYRQV